VNNDEFYKDMNLIYFLREVGLNLRMNNMLNKDSVNNRLRNNNDGMSFTEFSY